MPELDGTARRRIVRGVWDNLGRTVAELPHVGGIAKDTPSGPGWEMIGEEFLIEQAARGGPAIFVSGHIANWEMMPVAVARYGMRMHSMYRAPSNKPVDELLLDLRRRAIGANADSELPLLFAKGAIGARFALRHLSKAGYLGFLIDQKMNDGIEVPFFGLPAMTAPALAALALRYRCPVIPGHVQRLGPARFRLICEPPIAIPETGDARTDQLALIKAVNLTLERWIRERPAEWLWLHRRWKEG
jgi:KDO2-lipid IV(A) lauroyltransferase